MKDSFFRSIRIFIFLNVTVDFDWSLVSWSENKIEILNELFFRCLISGFYTVPRAGVEPARPNGHMALNHACLPVPAPGQYKYLLQDNIKLKKYRRLYDTF